MPETNDFDLFIGLVLARLYENRPKRLDFEGPDFIEPIDDDEQYDVERMESWTATMFWLREEGYIRPKDVYTGNVTWIFSQVELTEKGFRALNAVPQHLSKSGVKKSVGTRLAELVKEGGWKAGSKLAEKGAGEGASAIGEFVQNFFS